MEHGGGHGKIARVVPSHHYGVDRTYHRSCTAVAADRNFELRPEFINPSSQPCGAA